MTRSGTLLRRAVAIVIAFAGLVHARANEDAPVELPEVVVPLPRPETAAGPTAATTVVEVEQYAGEAKSTAELVATSPGVAVQQYGGLGKMATVSIRGSSADQVQVLLDGMPLNSPAGGGVDLSRIPPGWISRIEVVRGAEGAHYGAGALGGAVNVVTRPAEAGAWSAHATGGSFQTGSIGGDVSSGSDDWALLSAVSAESTSGRFPYSFDPTPTIAGGAEPRMRDHNGSRLVAGLLKGWAQLGPGRVDGLLEMSGGHRDLPGWPYYITPTDEQRDASGAARLRYSRPIANGLYLSADVSCRLDWLAVKLKLLGSRTVSQRGVDVGGSTTLRWLHGPGTLVAATFAGVQRSAGDGMPGRARAHLWASVAEDISLMEGRLLVAPAVRAERLGKYTGVSAKLGTRVLIAGPLSARAGVGRSFRAPSFAELYLQQGVLEPNPSLRPEWAWSGDAALVLDGAFGLASAGVFTSLYRDLIVYQSAAFRRVMPVNNDKALIRGVELELASAPLEQVLGASLGLAYTYMDTETLRGSEAILGKDLPRRPRHRLFARLGFKHDPIDAHVDAQYVSAQWQEYQNLQSIPAALAFGAGLGARIWRDPAVSLAVEVKNLLDDRTLQDGFANPLPGRMLLVTLRTGSSTQGEPE